jgi:hypothetical protein
MIAALILERRNPYIFMTNPRIFSRRLEHIFG